MLESDAKHYSSRLFTARSRDVSDPIAADLTSRPKLVHLIAADQFRSDYLPRFRDQYNGWLRILLDRGANLVNGKRPKWAAVN
jgi:hypothetical protein